MSKEIKYWVLPDIENQIKKNQVRALFNTVVTQVEPERIWVRNGNGERTLENDFVFALTGYHPDTNFLKQIGIQFDPETYRPFYNPETLVSRPRNSIAIVASATALISRSDDESMPAHWRGGATKKAGPSRRNPSGRCGLRPNSLSLVVADVTTSTPPRLATSARKPNRRLPCYFGDGTLEAVTKLT